jgi:Lipase (class 3)
MACFYPYDDSANALFRPAKGLGAADFFKDWQPDDALEDRLLCAEMSRLAYADETVVKAALPRAGFALKGWIGGGNALKGRFAAWGSDGFVASANDGRIVVAFRGTESDRPEDLLVDLLTRATPWPQGGLVHEGFAEALTHVRPGLDKALTVAGAGPMLVTGHSLGAGLATLVAASLRARAPRLITFGSPRVGDAEFAKLVDPATVARVVNCCDMVARVPPEAFDRPHIERLLEELTGNHAIAAIAAAGLAPVLSAAGISPRFVHVAPAQYVETNGKVSGQVDVQSDQDRARQAYRETHPLVAVNALGGLGELLAGNANVASAIRTAWQELFPVAAGGKVPIRDLADHAPINYVSAMVRSFRASGARQC